MRLRHNFVLWARARQLDLAAHSAVDVRELLRRVVVVGPRASAETLALRHFAEVAVEFVELLVRATWAREIVALLRRRIEEAVDRESIECVRNRLAFANDLLDRERSRVVVVIVGASTVTAELVEFTDRERINATIVERVEDRDAVRGERDGTLHEIRFAENGLLGEFRFQRNLPRVRARVVVRKRHLLLPRGDADHHLRCERRVRQAVRLDVEPALVEARFHERREGIEDRGLRGLRGGLRRCGGCVRCIERTRERQFNARLVDRANRGDPLVGVRASVTRKILKCDRCEIAAARRDADLSAARKDERAFDRLARANVRPQAARRRVELVWRMRACDRHAQRTRDSRREMHHRAIHAPPPGC